MQKPPKLADKDRRALLNLLPAAEDAAREQFIEEAERAIATFRGSKATWRHIPQAAARDHLEKAIGANADLLSHLGQLGTLADALLAQAHERHDPIRPATMRGLPLLYVRRELELLHRSMKAAAGALDPKPGDSPRVAWEKEAAYALSADLAFAWWETFGRKPGASSIPRGKPECKSWAPKRKTFSPVLALALTLAGYGARSTDGRRHKSAAFDAKDFVKVGVSRAQHLARYLHKTGRFTTRHIPHGERQKAKR